MFDIGFSELLLFGAIALIVLGPEKLPQAARKAGQLYAKFRRTVSTIQSEIEAELDLAETRKQMQSELEKIKQAELDMKREMDALRNSVSELQQHGKVPAMTTSNQPIDENATTLSQPEMVHHNPVSTQSVQSIAAVDNITDNTLTQSPPHSSIITTTQPTSTTLPVVGLPTVEAPNLGAEEVARDLHEAIFAATEPMYYRWFLLSDYDRVRRLPNAPFLPNYHADPLLHHHNGVANS